MFKFTWLRALSVALLVLVAYLNYIPNAFSNQLDTQLQVIPTRCVALHQGQTCYQLVDINWRINNSGSYCLFISSTKQALSCWQQNNAQNGFYKYDVQSAEDVVFSIKEMQSKKTIAQIRFEIAWVYRQSQQRRSSWRLF